MKKCNVCKEVKELPGFYRDKETKDGYMNRCKSCKNESTQKWRSANKKEWNAYMRIHRAEHPQSEKAKIQSANRSMKHRYGISMEEYNNLFTDQGGACRICEKHQSGFKKRLFIDHDHKTGKIRGLLCHNCNYYLSYILESHEIALKLANYILKHK